MNPDIFFLNALPLAGLALTGILLIKNDEYLISKSKEFSATNRWVKDTSSVVTHLGSAPYDLGIIGAFYLGGMIFKDPKARETAGVICPYL